MVDYLINLKFTVIKAKEIDLTQVISAHKF